MFKQILETIREIFSGPAAKGYVADITRYHRIQASPGYRQAAKYCHQRLTEWGVQAEIFSFPANERTRYWSRGMFQEWEATDATLHLIEPREKQRKLADYHGSKLSLIQRSAPFEGEAEVVLLEDGEEEAEYEGLGLAGRIVLTKGDLERVRELAVERHGAVGILYDDLRETPPIRQRLDLPDALQYTSFWWTGHEKKCFGFVLTPREGERLRALIKEGAREGKPPLKVRAKVDSRFYDGAIEVVSGLIPGEDDQEVVIVAHLCHPQPSANDNASGSATALEMARALGLLIAKGELARPRRGLRFLWIPEMTGTYAYLATHEEAIPRMIAGLNLDMVGEDQDRTGSSLLLVRSPAATPSFADALLEALLEAASDEAKGFGGMGGFSLFRRAETPFMAGSDHYVLADPTVGVPCPMLNQWPDRFYHTSLDTLDKVDPRMLARVGAVAATYAYWIANAGPQEAVWLGHEMVARFKGEILRLVQGKVTEVMGEKTAGLSTVLNELKRQGEFLVEREHGALASLKRLSPSLDVEGWKREVAEFARAELARGQAIIRDQVEELPQTPPTEPTEEEKRAAGMIPRRLYRGPIWAPRYLHKLSPADRERWYRLGKEYKEAMRVVPVLALYWADGKRTLLEIAQRVELEMGRREVSLLMEYFELLSRMGLITMHENLPCLALGPDGAIIGGEK